MSREIGDKPCISSDGVIGFERNSGFSWSWEEGAETVVLMGRMGVRSETIELRHGLCHI